MSSLKPPPQGPSSSTEAPEQELSPDMRERLDRFMKGELTLAEMGGFDGPSQRRLAEIGLKLMDAGKLLESRAIFEGIVALNPREGYSLMALGALAQREQRWAESVRWYQKSIEQDETNSVAWANLGEVFLMMGNLPDSSAALMRAVELDPQGKRPQTRRSAALLAELQKQLAARSAGG